jgi:hypothetical protein
LKIQCITFLLIKKAVLGNILYYEGVFGRPPLALDPAISQIKGWRMPEHGRKESGLSAKLLPVCSVVQLSSSNL